MRTWIAYAALGMFATGLSACCQQHSTCTSQPSKSPTSQSPTKPSPPPLLQPPASPSAATPTGPDKLKYDAHMTSAQAYVDANEKAKAIDAYEKAILAAPDESSRASASEKLRSITSWANGDWASPWLKQFQAIWVWIALFAGLWLLFLGYRLIRRLIDRLMDRHRVLIGPNGNEYAGYFRDLIRLTNYALDEQRQLAQRINAANAATVTASFRSNNLISGLPLGFPAEFASKWWWSVAQWLVNLLDVVGYRYRVDLCMMRSGSQCGVSIRLSCGSQVIKHWYLSCEDKELPTRSMELAFQVVYSIQGHGGT
jgi:hypothetical protein